MTQTNFPKNLFDFDFQAEEEAIRFRREVCAEIEAEERDERLTKLRKLSRRALDEDRMDAYFRLLDSIDQLECRACEPCDTAQPYACPTVRLSYVGEIPTGATVTGSDDSAQIFRDSYNPGEIGMQEFFKVMYLSRNNKPLGVHTVSMGGLTSTAVDVKLIFMGALLARATSIIICHNHPSGALRPSIQDDNLTRKINEAAKLLDITMLDHIILSDNGYFSYRNEGKI